MFRSGDPDAAFRYYLNLEPIGGRYFKQVNGAEVPFVREWGLETSLEDLRRVVLRARDGGRRTVILGGHSLGASTTAAYATWDFDGHPGYEDIAGMVLIDGGLLGTFTVQKRTTLLGRLRALERGGAPFVALLAGLPPWAAGAFAESAALFALKAPDAPSVLQAYPLTPKEVLAPVPVTNAAAFAYALDEDSSPAFLDVVHFNGGGLAATGDPRGWTDGGVTPVSRLFQAFTHEPGNFVDWYFPARLTLDVDAANSLRRDATTRAMKLRTWHLAEVDRPLYAFETNLTGGRVLRGARRFAAASRVPRPTLVADHAQAHLDPLLAAPERNRFLATVVPFLRKVKTGS